MMHLLGRLAYFSLIGFVAIVLAGPTIGVIGTLLPFAIVGFALYGAYRGIERMVFGKRKSPAELDVPPTELRHPKPVVVRDALPVVEKVREETPARPGRLRRVGWVMQEMVCGAAVAGCVAAVFCWQAPAFGETIGAAIACGAIVGFVVGRSVPEGVKSAQPVCAGESC